MRALVFHGPKNVRVERVEDPRLERTTDVIVRVTTTSICGSDLHLYDGRLPSGRPGVLGHEFVGVVEEVGPEVRKLRRGDRVVVPCSIACGSCFFCRDELPAQCERAGAPLRGDEESPPEGRHGALFGGGGQHGGHAGGQAEYARVPFADVGPRKVPDALSDEQVLFLGDILPTGWAALDWAGVKPGESVAVFGCGPVGLMVLKAARLYGAKQIIGLDREPCRLEAARHLTDARTIDVREGNAIEMIREMTGGRGADVCVDAVGMGAVGVAAGVGADGIAAAGMGAAGMGAAGMRAVGMAAAGMAAFEGRPDEAGGAGSGGDEGSGGAEAFKEALGAVRYGGRVSVVGAYGPSFARLPLGLMFEKGLRVSLGRASVHAYIDELLAHVIAGRLRADDIISHRFSLREGPEAYELFSAKRDGCIKVVLKP